MPLMGLTPEELVLSEKEQQDVRSAHSQVDFKFGKGGHMIEISADQADYIEQLRAGAIFSREAPGELEGNADLIDSLVPQIKVVQVNPTNPHFFVEVPLKPSKDHYIEFVFAENMRGDIMHTQKYWASFADSPKFACEGSALTSSITVYAVSSKYGVWKATAEVKEMPPPTDTTPGMGLWWLTEEVRGPPEAFKSYKAGVMPKYQGAPFEPPNSGFI